VSFGCAAVAILVASACSGCAPRACAGPAMLSPAVWLDASSWLAAHPGVPLRACFDHHCQQINSQHEPVQLRQLDTNPATPERLTISSTSPDGRTLFNDSVALKETVEHGPCGDVQFWGLNARVQHNGEVKLLGWSGHYLPPAEILTTPTPAATP
jgi:hypothetical protein